MSELMNISGDRGDYRRQLLTSVCAFALLGLVCSAIEPASADDDADRPTVWIELGGQFEQFSKAADIFTPPFVAANNWQSMKLTSPAAIQATSPYSIGGEASISFEPEGSDWVFSAGVRYGRSHGYKHEHDQPPPPRIPYYVCPNHCLGQNGYASPAATNYENATASTSESHAILDFQAGKDIGLGMFGKGGTSVVSAGIRFAQFSSKALINQHAVVKEGFFNGFPPSYTSVYLPFSHHNAYALYGHSERSFRGLGPSISWKASAPLVRIVEDAGINFDWGVNAALLFGRQKANVVHHTTGQYYVDKYHNGFSQGLHTLYQHAGAPPARGRSVIVPNLGGMAGLSFLYSSAKVSFGYRADFFFGAMDGGLDTRKSENRAFYGPFASVSVGIP